ncbi:MAG: hypothetical protein ACKPEO_28965 [Sphaerospermopsis kisseleviana]
MNFDQIVESNLKPLVENICNTAEVYFTNNKEDFDIEYFQIGDGKNGEDTYELYYSYSQTNQISVVFIFPIYVSPKTNSAPIHVIQNKLYEMIDHEIINWSQKEALLQQPLKPQDINGDLPKKVQIGQAPVFKLNINRKFDLNLN